MHKFRSHELRTLASGCLGGRDGNLKSPGSVIKLTKQGNPAVNGPVRGLVRNEGFSPGTSVTQDGTSIFHERPRRRFHSPKRIHGLCVLSGMRSQSAKP